MKKKKTVGKDAKAGKLVAVRTRDPDGKIRTDIRSRDVFRPIARERNDLMDYNWGHYPGRIRYW